jgi:PAS domain S-box-containing protein
MAQSQKTPKSTPHLKTYTLLLATAWTATVIASLVWSYVNEKAEVQSVAYMGALARFEKDVIYRRWNAGHGGVYVPVTEKSPPNPYLSNVPERDIVTTSGRKLTLINPATMTRQAHQLGWEATRTRGQITSLNPINPKNAPDPWEKSALQAFGRGDKEISSIEMLDGAPHLRLMRPLLTENGCLRCHARQGYREGDIRGGIGISLPMEPFLAVSRERMKAVATGHGALWLLGLVGIFTSGTLIARRRRGQREAEEARRESEEKLRNIIEHSTNLFYSHTCDHELTYLSPQTRDFFDCEPEEALRNWKTFATDNPINEKGIALTRKAIDTGESQPPYELELIGVKGRKLRVEVHEAPLVHDGKTVAIVGALTDITHRRIAEEERLNLERQVQHAQKLESLGVLAGGVAHDFNNILMTILGNADIALDDLSPHAPARKNVREIEDAAKRAADLARQMLAYSGKGKFVLEAIDLNEFVGEMGHMLKVSISRKAVLKYNFADNLPHFEGDATQVRQIIMNLITNASEAIGEKSGVIAISTGAMHCDREYLESTDMGTRGVPHETLPEGMYLYFEVADTGCGMSTETQNCLFDPFFTTKFTGRGLGMAAVLGIVRGHNGSIKVYSEEGKGSTFKVLFPAAEAVEPASRRKKSAELPAWRGEGTILVADDEDTIRAITKTMLERIGFTVLTAPDGREALEIFRSHEEIGCVLLDLTMPHMDGEQTFREIRRIRPETKVILLSGYNKQDATQRFSGKGLDGFIQKPYNSALLIKTVRHVLDVK